jgi:uncharacterized membrane protein
VEQSESIKIRRPLEDVWGYVGDVRWWPKWLKDVSDVRLMSDDLAPGAEVAYKWRGKDVTATIAEYEPGSRIGIAAVESGYDFHESMSVDATEGHTEVTFTMGFSPTSTWMRILSVLLRPLKGFFLGRPLRKELETLRESVESGSAG